jgi:5-methylcytosine-specific restriction endonuclease McrA
MIKINFIEPDEPDWIAWRNDCENATKRIIEQAKNGENYEISNLYKKKEIKQKYYISIDGPFSGKCAYCETPIPTGQYGDMEHFRPKNAVTDENGKTIEIENEQGQTIPHPGYYWLAYDWKNLLPACEKCNRPNPGDATIGKHNKFPITNGHHASAPGEEKNEQPLLLNPLLDDPEDHIEIDMNTGILGGDERAQSCINILGLNIRPGLCAARKDAYDRVLGLLSRYFYCEDDSKLKQYAKELCEIVEGKSPYSLIGRTYLKKRCPRFIDDLKEKLCGL